MAGRPIPGDLKKMMQKATVMHTDMTPDMMQDSLDIVTGSIDKHAGADGINMEAAARLIKDSLDKQYGFNWHCAIGQGFSFDVTSQNGTLLHAFYQAEYAILVYKC
eukprot:TRINITY_DN32492_c0_g1_i3.p3 TRINITY_DN32492_c0_g1~~TRINITY_DN32492_c0_g1_i3.p3  ORF type:complete len:106 (+),score=29.01 TRINITY_DN32492_c0_g1_i3:132-449(+)